MKTKLIYFAAIAALTIAGCSKEGGGDPLAPPPTPEKELYDVYIAGSIFNKTTDMSGYWKNDEWHDLALPIDDGFCFTTAIALHEGKVYVILDHTYFQVAGCYIDGVWHANQLPDGARYISASSSIGFLDGSVYMAGYSVMESGMSIACYWKDGVCHPLTIPGCSGSTSAASLAISGGSVYIAGNGEYDTIAGYWQDEVWNPITIPDGFSILFLRNIACSEGSVYVAGNLDYDQACFWVDGVTQILSAPDGVNCYVSDIAVADGSVYIAGAYSRDNSCACYWKDGVFHALDAPGASYTQSIEVIDGMVFIAGNYELSDHEGGGCYWKDGVRVDIPVPEGMRSHVGGMTVVKKQ